MGEGRGFCRRQLWTWITFSLYLSRTPWNFRTFSELYLKKKIMWSVSVHWLWCYHGIEKWRKITFLFVTFIFLTHISVLYWFWLLFVQFWRFPKKSKTVDTRWQPSSNHDVLTTSSICVVDVKGIYPPSLVAFIHWKLRRGWGGIIIVYFRFIIVVNTLFKTYPVCIFLVW